jgi:hypothetical protein
MSRSSLLLGGLLCGAITAVYLWTATPQIAAGPGRKAGLADTTECLALTILANPPALRRAREGAWMEAVQLIGYQCGLSDAAYAPDLANALATRLRAAAEFRTPPRAG